jgi:hypothetical protein
MEASNNIIISIWIEYESMDKYKCISTIAIGITTIWEWSEMRTDGDEDALELQQLELQQFCTKETSTWGVLRESPPIYQPQQIAFLGVLLPRGPSWLAQHIGPYLDELPYHGPLHYG